MADKKTTTILARIDTDSRARFRKMAGAHGLSESELLRSLVLRQIDTGGFVASPVAPDPKESDLAPMTVRMPRFLMKAAKDRAKAKGMAPSRWVAALVQSNLTREPVMSEAELVALEESNRELAAIGRNINQIARALNEAFHQTERVRLDKLAELDKAIKENRSMIRMLVRASQNAWDVE
ncbi:MAG: hypothetical protein JWQ00_1578 [Noviherbaspirillum sp.]|jgi:predicted DNA binding CopG/RHH family protein|nr:hypothetical protein [Noviherbaspirillum sp.]